MTWCPLDPPGIDLCGQYFKLNDLVIIQKVSYGGIFGGFDVPTVPTSPLPPETRGISGGLGGVVPGAASHRNDAGTRRWTLKAAWLQLKFQNEPENHEVAARRNAVING